MPTFPEHLISPPFVSEDRVYVYAFVDRCLSVSRISFDYWVVCSSLIYGFLLPLQCLQTLLKKQVELLYNEICNLEIVFVLASKDVNHDCVQFWFVILKKSKLIFLNEIFINEIKRKHYGTITVILHIQLASKSSLFHIQQNQ